MKPSIDHRPITVTPAQPTSRLIKSITDPHERRRYISYTQARKGHSETRDSTLTAVPIRTGSNGHDHSMTGLSRVFTVTSARLIIVNISCSQLDHFIN